MENGSGELLKETIAKIRPISAEFRQKAEENVRSWAGEGRALGRLEDLLITYMSATKSVPPPPLKHVTIIACADHGVAEMGVSAYPPETTVEMTRNYLIAQGAAANALAKFCDSDLLVVDMGIKAETKGLAGLIDRKIAHGTKNLAKGAAMTREEAIRSLEAGIELVEKCHAEGYNCFLTGEMGIANTTSSAAICSVLAGIPPAEATGRGTNISDERLMKKIAIVAQAIAVNQPDATDGIDVLAKLGGFELGCIAGIQLAAAANGCLALLDGFNTGAAALIAQSLAPAVTDYLVPSHRAAERGHAAMLKKLGHSAFMDLDFRLGEACGSSLLVNTLRIARALCPANQQEENAPTKEQIAELSKEEKEHLEVLISDEDYTVHKMPEGEQSAGDKVLDIYFSTMPEPSKRAMEMCQERLDNLAKPIYSLGVLEGLAALMAGILDEDRPDKDINVELLCFSYDELKKAQKDLLTRCANEGRFFLNFAELREDCTLETALNFGRSLGESTAFSAEILLLTCKLKDEAHHAEIIRALIGEDGALAAPPDAFISTLPAEEKRVIIALFAAIIAGAHNSSLILLDGGLPSMIGRYAEALCPKIKPYLYHADPKVIDFETTLPGLSAALGLITVDAALSILCDMKTFEETKVSIAQDGPGKTRQVRQS